MTTSASVQQILLVDDDPAFLDTLSALLRHEGYDVATESTYDNAMRHLTSTPPDILITDVRLALNSGWQLAKHATRFRPSVRTIMVTGLADYVDGEVEYWRLPVFLKPFDPDQLIDYLRTGR